MLMKTKGRNWVEHGPQVYGDALRVLREKAGVSQNRLGLAIGNTQNAICQWESGAYPIPRAKRNAILSFLGVTIGEWRIQVSRSGGTFNSKKRNYRKRAAPKRKELESRPYPILVTKWLRTVEDLSDVRRWLRGTGVAHVVTTKPHPAGYPVYAVWRVELPGDMDCLELWSVDREDPQPPKPGEWISEWRKDSE